MVEQEKVIMDILRSGDIKKHRRLLMAKEDPALNPEIKALIIKCERKVQIAIGLTEGKGYQGVGF